MPRSMLDRWRWLIHWREARFQCAYPRVTYAFPIAFLFLFIINTKTFFFILCVYDWIPIMAIFNSFDEITK